MDIRWNADQKFAAVASGGNGFRNCLPLLLQIRHNVRDDAANASEGRFRASGQPTEAGEFNAEPDVLGVFVGPGYTIGIMIIF
jgi:hypothetical protein